MKGMEEHEVEELTEPSPTQDLPSESLRETISESVIAGLAWTPTRVMAMERVVVNFMMVVIVLLLSSSLC